jgi:hypothetical protein
MVTMAAEQKAALLSLLNPEGRAIQPHRAWTVLQAHGVSIAYRSRRVWYLSAGDLEAAEPEQTATYVLEPWDGPEDDYTFHQVSW